MKFQDFMKASTSCHQSTSTSSSLLVVLDKYLAYYVVCRLPGVGISMTDASAKPYTSTTNGSMNSVDTTSTTLGSNGSTLQSTSTIQKSPLRSSLKKPKPKDGLGIQNPGFSGSSPTFSRNGSVKKVRIQTHSTDV